MTKQRLTISQRPKHSSCARNCMVDIQMYYICMVNSFFGESVFGCGHYCCWLNSFRIIGDGSHIKAPRTKCENKKPTQRKENTNLRSIA